MIANHHSIEKVGSGSLPADREGATHDEYQKNISYGMSPEDAQFLAGFGDDRKKEVVKKIDLRLVPMLLLLYLITYIDKTNIGNAKIEGMLSDLRMDGTQYNIALSVFFIPYVLAEIPSNMILERFTRPSWYLGSLIVSWGIIMTLTGIVQNFGGLTVIRLLLGLFEAGFFPGAILLISKWYLPHETQTRIALLYTSAASGGALSGLLAFAIAKMDGVANLSGWRWIFIVEGIFTVVMGVSCFFFLIDSPSLSTRWLEPDEIRYLNLRQVSRHLNNGSECDNSKKRSHNWADLTDVLTDWKLWLLIFANWSNAVPNYALKFTMPQIIKNMGFTSAKAQLLTIPPYSCGALSAYILGHFSDKLRWRMPFIVAPQLSLVVAFSILFVKAAEIKNNIPLCYFAVCLACAGMYPILPGVNAWNVANLHSPTRRAIGIGFLIAMGNAGGIISSYIYKENEAPRYPTGFGTSFGFAAAGIIATLALEAIFIRINRKRDCMDESEIRAKYSSEQLERMGERSPLVRYAL